MAIKVDHIADVSLADHFLEGEALVNGKITVMGSTTNGNTFDVKFDDGKVNVRFASGNFFTNMFRGKTLARLTKSLQNQYEIWLAEQEVLEAKRAEEARITGGYKDNPNAGKVAAVVEEFKAALAKANPPNLKQQQDFLDGIAKLAELRNTLTRVERGSDCHEAVGKAGFLIHTNDYAKDLDDHGKKGYILRTIDTVIDGLIQVAGKMTDKAKQVPDFMLDFDGACVEAKGDNLMDWLAREAGIIKAARSTKAHDLAYSINAEFKYIADGVLEPYVKEARASCEAEIRADFAEKGIEDELIISETIETKVQQILYKKDDEIRPKIRQALEEKGKFVLYEALVGAKRPMTEISRDEDTKVWTVTKLVDANGAPIMKSVSAYDIDNVFSRMVDMFLEDALTMGMVVNETRTAENITFATRADLRGDAVVALAEKYAAGGVDKTELARLVKAEIPFAAEIPENEFAQHLERALGDIAALKCDDPAEAKNKFRNFASNYANGAYFDKTNDLGRLVHLLASRTATLASPEKKILANIDAMATRCAQMMRNAYPDHHVFVGKAQTFIAKALRNIVKKAFHGPEDDSITKEAKEFVDKLAVNGNLFTDNIRYDLAHRAAGRDEVKLHDALRYIHRYVRRFAGAEASWYMKPKGKKM